MITNMKAIIRTVTIEGEKFYGVRFNIEGEAPEKLAEHGLSTTMYGTLPYDRCDEHGVLIKQTSLLHLAAEKTMAEAIDRRRKQFEALKELQRLMNAGLIQA